CSVGAGLIRACPDDREPNGEARAPAFFARDGDRPTVLLHDLTHPGQAQPGADSSGSVARSIEALEDVRQIGGWNPDPLIPDDEEGAGLRPLLLSDLDGDLAVVRTVLDRVGEQVA